MEPEAPDVPLTVEDLLAGPQWHQLAACRGQDVRPWFSGATEHLELARRICAGCDVQAECAAYAMADKHLQDVWFETTESEHRVWTRPNLRDDDKGQRLSRTRAPQAPFRPQANVWSTNCGGLIRRDVGTRSGRV
jgi:Transcription factor WhiB